VAPPGRATRPTGDKVRGAIFNVLGQFFEGGEVLDLYAGSGALALEALSRGMARAVCVESDRRAAECIERNAAACGLAGRVEVRREPVEAALSRLPAGRFALVLLDPPWNLGPGAVLPAVARVLAPGGTVVAEHDARHPPGDPPEGLVLSDRRAWGSTGISIYRARSFILPPPMPRRAIYPGSFDPLTNGHTSLIQRGLKVFDGLVVAVANNPSKVPLFSVEERKRLIREAVNGDPRVEVDSFDGLLVDYAKARGVHTVLRGLRAVSDFEYEFQIANMNRNLDPEFESVFMMTGEDYFYVASSLVREVASFGGDVSKLVPHVVYKALQARFAGKR
jgi:pantetheine-phosphate adenylyltransferase